MIRAYVYFVARHPEFARLMNEEGKRRGSHMRWIVDRHVAPLYRSVEELVERDRRDGALLSGASAVHFFYILAGAAGTLFHQSEECKRVSVVDPFDPAVIAEHARLVEQLLLGRDEPLSSENRKP